MTEIEISKVEYKDFGQCVRVTNGEIELLVTIERGPRIIRFGFIKGENIFNDAATGSAEIMGDTWHLMGGHRLWHSPEASPRTYVPDNSPVEWSKLENGIKITQAEEPWVQTLKEMEITMDSKANKVKILHRIVNKNAWPIELAAWSISAMSLGGMEVIPQPDRETNLLPNRKLVLWPYTKMNDSRVYWGDKYITLTQTYSEQALKFGINCEKQWAAYFNNNNLMVIRYNHDTEAQYPDYGVSYETFTRYDFLELETLSPLKVLQSEGEIAHEECWELYDDVKRPDSRDEEGLDKILGQFF